MVAQMLQMGSGRKARRRGGDSESNGESGEGGRQGGAGNSAPGSGSERVPGTSGSDDENVGGEMLDSDEAGGEAIPPHRHPPAQT